MTSEHANDHLTSAEQVAVADDEGGLYVDADQILTARNVATSAPISVPGGEQCPNCQALTITRDVPWCSRCGFYPRLNIFVEPDEAATAQATAGPQPAAWKRIPGWVYVLVIGMIAVAGTSIAARLSIPPGSIIRPLLAIGQFLFAMMIFAAMHLGAYLYAIVADSQIGLFDIVMRPLRVWGPTLRALPHTARRLCLAVWSLLAAVLALTVIGGIPYHLIWEIGPEEQAKTNLVHAIVDQARQAEPTDQSMEEALKDFTGEASGDKTETPAEEFPKPPARAKKLDCLIVGYKPLGEDNFSELILAGVDRGKLQILGTVDTKYIPPDVQAELMAAMLQHPTETPFIKTTLQAKWVQPVFTCRIGFNGWNNNRRMQDTVFYKRLANVNQK